MMDEGDREVVVQKFAGIVGIGRSRAEALVDGGYTTVTGLKRASPEELAKVRGFTPMVARHIAREIERLPDDSVPAGEEKRAMEAPPEDAAPAAAAEQAAPVPSAPPASQTQKSFLSGLFGKTKSLLMGPAPRPETKTAAAAAPVAPEKGAAVMVTSEEPAAEPPKEEKPAGEPVPAAATTVAADEKKPEEKKPSDGKKE